MASSNLIEANQASSSQPSLTEGNIGMDPKYYKAAANGEIEVFQRITGPLNQLLTPNRNTVLHIHLASLIEGSESSTAFVKDILKKSLSLLWQANVKGESPLHIAARYGHAPIVEVLIESANSPQQEDLESGVRRTVEEMLEMTNNEKDTAFHEAVRGNHLEVVKYLIKKGPQVSYSRNKAGETPLYIAVERGFKNVIDHILENCASPAHEGPLGRTTLHAAVFSKNKEMIQKILGKRSALIKQVDEQCWTPLHCVAYFGGSVIAKVFLEVDRSIAYMKDANGMTALHIAAHQGHLGVIESILEGCPDCCELVDKRGWNALHFVVNSPSSKWAKYGAEYILKKSSPSNLLNEKDDSGNTPLHHHSKSLHYIADVMCHDRVDKMAFNERSLNAYDVALTSEELSDEKFMQIRSAFNGKGVRAELRIPLGNRILPRRKDYGERWGRLKAKWKAGEVLRKDYGETWERWKAEWKAHDAAWKVRKERFVCIMKETSQYHLVVDTLIATVAFTAGLTMPGGFIGQEGPHSGSPVLMRNTAFKAFIITNTIAMVQSCSAAFIQMFMPLLFHVQNLGNFSFLMASLAFCLSISAMGAMVLAFVMGTYAVLMHSWGLAIANSVIGLFFFIPVFFVSIGCLNYLLEILRVGSSWIVDKLCDFKNFLRNAFFGIRRRFLIFYRRRRN